MKFVNTVDGVWLNPNYITKIFADDDSIRCIVNGSVITHVLVDNLKPEEVSDELLEVVRYVQNAFEGGYR